MDFIKLSKTNSKQVDSVYRAYCEAFPEDERRNKTQFQGLFKEQRAQMLLVKDGQEEVGYLILWNLTDCHYLEHFEVFPTFRNLGWGARILSKLRMEYPRIILECEPADFDEFANRRLAFYQRSGFEIVCRDYIQPPYAPGKKAMNLFLMGTFVIENKKQCIAELYQVVYGC